MEVKLKFLFIIVFVKLHSSIYSNSIEINCEIYECNIIAFYFYKYLWKGNLIQFCNLLACINMKIPSFLKYF